ncbi:voltage-dependent anion channel [Desarmillaria tabescens]|uniref:Voltage-dependent anion channel n=1 Tax=Armillaria tabescens TaxID=1929756 RepID=A0AA39N8R5_ARMTA|nr:voltage-dependent anion channel [Desarmillaria tabescens]KAK0461122.1 voltage-dependent anion channel [Desarmillaria tabescens]
MTSDTYHPNKTFKDVVRHFAPAWFAVIMGTGAISTLFHAFPYGTGSQGLRIMTLIFFFLNLCLFITFCAISLVRYITFPDIWGIMIRHPVQSLFTGTFPMGAITILNIAVSLIHDDYGFGGKPFLYVLWAFWWLDVISSFLCCFGVMHFMITAQKHSLESMTSVWLLPVVTLIVASSGGWMNHAVITATFSIFMVSIGLSIALMMLTVYLLRLVVPWPPSRRGNNIGYSILLLGQFFKSVLPLNYGDSELLNDAATGATIHVICTIISLILWSLASMWLFFAVLGVQNVLRQTRIPFKVQVWGIIFPNGVYANLTLSLASTFDSPFFRVWGSIYSVATLIVWCLVASRTVMLAWNKQIFEAPCLGDIDMAQKNKCKETELQAINPVCANGNSTDTVHLT